MGIYMLSLSGDDKDGLRVGMPAPDFQAPDSNGNIVRLQDSRGSWVVLYFYPKALTPG